MSTDAAETDTPDVDPFKFRFRIVHLFYATALFASSLATFGPGGLYPAVVLFGGWTYVFVSKSRPQALVVFVTIAAAHCCLCFPGGHPREAARRMHCSNNLKQIALALHNYHDVYKTFPPAMLPDADGKPVHSWRVLILPFIEEQKLYDSYDFSEPWDGPNNRLLANPMPSVYVCPSHSRGNCTSYAAVIGERTMWTGDEHGVRIQNVSDGTSNTILVLEAELPQSNWMEPRDITYEEAVELLISHDPMDRNSGHKHEDFFYEHWTGRQTALADGSVRFVPLAIPRAIASALLMRDDGNEFGPNDVESRFRPVSRLRWDNCFRLALFILIALFPLPWVWLRPPASREAG
jgi:hypothetical protein